MVLKRLTPIYGHYSAAGAYCWSFCFARNTWKGKLLLSSTQRSPLCLNLRLTVKLLTTSVITAVTFFLGGQVNSYFLWLPGACSLLLICRLITSGEDCTWNIPCSAGKLAGKPLKAVLPLVDVRSSKGWWATAVVIAPRSEGFREVARSLRQGYRLYSMYSNANYKRYGLSHTRDWDCLAKLSSVTWKGARGDEDLSVTGGKGKAGMMERRSMIMFWEDQIKNTRNCGFSLHVTRMRLRLALGLWGRYWDHHLMRRTWVTGFLGHFSTEAAHPSARG